MLAGQNAAALGMELVFTTDDVSAAYERAVKAVATALKAPVTEPWRQTVA